MLFRSGLEEAERAVARIRAAGDRRAEVRESFVGRLDGGSISLGLGIEERRLRREPMGRAERHPPPDAERSSARVGVEDQPGRPRPAAEDDRPRRPRVGGPALLRQVEEEMRAIEMKESHGRSVFRALD